MKTAASERSRYRAAVRHSIEEYNRKRRPWSWLIPVPRLHYNIRRRAPSWRRRTRAEKQRFRELRLTVWRQRKTRNTQ